MKQISWEVNDEYSITLIDCVSVNDFFFMQPLISPMKQECYETGNHRKLKERMSSLRKWFKTQVEIRNKSAIESPEPSRLYLKMKWFEEQVQYGEDKPKVDPKNFRLLKMLIRRIQRREQSRNLHLRNLVSMDHI